MQILYAVAGIVIIAVVIKDLITTTLSFQGGGRITNYVSQKLWQFSVKLAKGNGRKRVLERVGHYLLVIIVLMWVTGIWLGAFLLLLSDQASVLNSNTDATTTAWEKLYFAGYTLSTMGNGDYKPGSYLWDIVANLLAFGGLGFITISITYIMPVLTAVILQVKISVFLNSLGDTPQQVLLNSWNGKNFDRLLRHDAKIADMLIQHAQNHKAYPIIHYFHNAQKRQSIIQNLAVLDEAISFLKHAVPEEIRPSDTELLTIRGGQDFYLQVLNEHQKNEELNAYELPVMNWNILASAGIPLIPERVQEFGVEKLFERRRRTLTYLLYQDGWTWDDIYQKQPDRSANE